MRNPEDRLKFLVKIATTDFESMREGEWLDFKTDCFNYTSKQLWLNKKGQSTGLLTIPMDETSNSVAFVPTKDELKEIQNDLRKLLENIVDVRNYNVDSEGPGPIVERFPLTLEWSAGPGEGADPYLIEAKGSLHDIVLISALYLISRERRADQISRCPECSQLFYRVRKQIYCSRRCTNRVAARTKWNKIKNAKRKSIKKGQTKSSSRKAKRGK